MKSEQRGRMSRTTPEGMLRTLPELCPVTPLPVPEAPPMGRGLLALVSLSFGRQSASPRALNLQPGGGGARRRQARLI